MQIRFLATILGMSVVFVGRATASPIPMHHSLITVEYETVNGPVEGSGERDYTGSMHHDATMLEGLPNMIAFSSLNDFGRRGQLLTNPPFAGAVRPGESLIAHAFFKHEDGHHHEFFPDLANDGRIRVTVTEHYDQPVYVDRNTFMFHVLWDASQSDKLDVPYVQIDDHYTITPSFRDLDMFLQAGLFSNAPVPNYVQNSHDFKYRILGEGTETLTIELKFPYELLRNLEEQGQTVPDGFPAPGGFLEPFHFHIEYTVVPEPASLLLMLGAFPFLFRRR